MKNVILRITTLFLIIGSMAVNATLIINVNEIGNDVVFSTSGSLDISQATYLGGIGYNDGFISGGSNWYVASGTGSSVDNYALAGFDGDGSFGTNTNFFNNPASIAGDDFFIWGNGGNIEQVGVEVGYISGNAILSEMTFANATIAGFGMLTGTYNYYLPNDLVTLNIGGAANVPEPSVIALFATGLVGFVFARRRIRS